MHRIRLAIMNHPDSTHCACPLFPGEREGTLCTGFYFGTRTSLKWFLLMIDGHSPRGLKQPTLRLLSGLCVSRWPGGFIRKWVCKSHRRCWKHLLRQFLDKGSVLCCQPLSSACFSVDNRLGLSRRVPSLPRDAALALLPGPV